ncbi:MAG: fatty acid--CoA ligase family protein [Bacillaceae bacterium]|nr:fatty acid--CoA ligase family protein [Bacillaceae bacterium]
MNLNQNLLRSVEAAGDKEAYYFQGRSATYHELNRQVASLADSLERLGLEKGDHIGLLLGNSPEFVISLYGATRIGATVIPINPIYTAEEISYILNNGNVKAVIAVEQLAPLLEKVSVSVPSLQHVILVGAAEDLNHTEGNTRLNWKALSTLLANGDPAYEGPVVDEEDVAVILYTSGTTGRPKGAMLTHKNLCSNALSTVDYLGIKPEDRVVTVLPMFHVFSLTVCLNAPLATGATLLIIPRFSPEEVIRTIKEQKATFFAGVPTMYNFMLQYPDARPEDLSSLRVCVSGGASMPVALLHQFQDKFNVQISEGYGLSEASPVVCFNPLDRPAKPGSIGTAVTDVECRVVDEAGNEVPVGEVGELIVKGPNVMKGYYRMPEETATTLRDGWLYTGDLARKDEEDYYYIVDRKKDMVIVGGYNVYPREVEEVLYQHPDVVEAAVIGEPDEEYGEIVKAFIVSRNETLTEQDLINYCKEHLARYKIPSRIEFLEELPKNSTGKILRRALRTQNA